MKKLSKILYAVRLCLYYPLTIFYPPLKVVRGLYRKVEELISWIWPGYHRLPIYAQKLISILLIISISLSSFYSLSFLLAPKASAAWYDDSWGYRQRACPEFTERVDITNSGSAQTSYNKILL